MGRLSKKGTAACCLWSSAGDRMAQRQTPVQPGQLLALHNKEFLALFNTREYIEQPACHESCAADPARQEMVVHVQCALSMLSGKAA